MSNLKIAGEEKREKDFTGALEKVLNETAVIYEKMEYDEISQCTWEVLAGVMAILKTQEINEGIYHYGALSFFEMIAIKKAVFDMYIEKKVNN